MISIGGLALNAGGTLDFELGPTTYDRIVASGNVSLAGILNVSLVSGFTPTADQSFNILDWGVLSGTFSSLSLPTHAGLAWNTSQLYTTGMLSLAAAGLPGDYNQNGTVDAADYTVWRDHLGQTFTLINESSSAMTPGLVDTEDYAFWKSRFGETFGGGASATLLVDATIPEPATLVLLILAAAYLPRRRR